MNGTEAALLIGAYPAEFALGFDEWDGFVCMTYSGGPTSGQSMAYDLGRTLGEALGQEDS